MKGDRTRAELIPQINAILAANPTALCFIKWDCPRCGDRCLSDTPNTISAAGYVHTERANGTPCGGVYTDDMFGFMLMFALR